MQLWDPFNDVVSLRDAMDRLLQDSFIRPSGGRTQRERGGDGAMLPLDLKESEDSYTIQASLPGVKPEDIQVQVVGDTVIIRGEVRDERENKQGEQVVLRERRLGRFARTVTLPMPIDPEHVEATFENGVLTLRLPKSQMAKPRRIEVRSTAGQQPQQMEARAGTQAQQQGQGQAASMSQTGPMGQQQESSQPQASGAS
jgi:HSP20 family protein